jgi:hypothetical protein
MYAQVKFTLSNPNGPITIPANAFVFRAEGPLVAVVTKENKIHWQPIQVGRDFGTYMEVLRGLDENGRVVVNPTDDLTEGLEVQPKEASPTEQGQGTSGSAKQGQSQKDQGQEGKTPHGQPQQGKTQQDPNQQGQQGQSPQGQVQPGQSPQPPLPQAGT